MSKHYYVEAKFGKIKTWHLIKTFTRQSDAIDYVSEHEAGLDKYPLRIIRVVRTVVFEDKK